MADAERVSSYMAAGLPPSAPAFMLCRAGPEGLAAVAAGALTFPVYQPYLQAEVLACRRLVGVEPV